MGNACYDKRRVVPKEKRSYKELVIEALQSEAWVLTQAECIGNLLGHVVNIDIDPENSKLNEIIKQVVQEEREKESCVDELSEISERGEESQNLELGVWKVQKLRRRLFRHTNYIAHLKIDTEITAANLIKIYKELFFILAQKNMQYVVMPQMWLDEHKYRVTQRENADALFDQLFTWRNSDQKYRATFIVFHTETTQAIQLVDSFLSYYNQFNPVIADSVSHQSENHEEDVEEDQKMLK